MPYQNHERLDQLRHPELDGDFAEQQLFDLQAFLAKYPAWEDWFLASDPVYAIPVPACKDAQLKFFFPAADHRAAEVEFAELCWSNGFIGVWNGNPIRFTPLHQKRLDLSTFSEEVLKKHFFGKPPNLDNLGSIGHGSDSANERLLGIVGWCNTNPGFCAERDALRAAYVAIPVEYRPALDVIRPVILEGHTNLKLHNGNILEVGEIPAAEAYVNRLLPFLDKWGIWQLATWDWLLPQGPLVPDLVPEGNSSTPRHGVTIFIPTSYPLMGDDELLRKIRDHQSTAARIQGLPDGLVALNRHKSFAQMARMLHLERTLRSRFPAKFPHGGVTRLMEMATHYLQVSDERVEWLRATIVKRLGGADPTVTDSN